jgi:hypothetical protein
MQKRIESTDDASNLYYKISLNGAYGYDIMNEENYSKSRILDREHTFMRLLAPNFVNSRKLGEDVFQVELQPKSFGCDTCTIEGLFTLDNSKFWYLNFIYRFMYKCLDMTRIHFVEGDTDSMYWAVAGDITEPNTQGFKHVLASPEFYNKNVYEFSQPIYIVLIPLTQLSILQFKKRNLKRSLVDCVLSMNVIR